MKRLSARLLHIFHRNALLSAGFTLIELLIVISVLGVLAVVVLVAIDPLEQIARGRDTGRINSVAELGRAMEAYATNNLGSYPASSATWQTSTLVAGGETKRLVTVPNQNTTVCTPNAEGNVCYAVTGTGSSQTAVIWTTLESKSSRSKAKATQAATTGCPTGTDVIAMWSSAQGKAGVACVSTTVAPPATQWLN